jgi:hypothetical protein
VNLFQNDCHQQMDKDHVSEGEEEEEKEKVC